MIKRITAVCLCLIPILSAMAGCSPEKERPTVLCTLFPIYDWVREIAGERQALDIQLLLSDGSDIHSFQPTAKDAITVGDADLVIRVGGVDDSFIAELMRGKGGVDLRLSECEGITLRKAAISSSHSHEDHSEHEHPIDEHIWLSLKNAAAGVDMICDALSALDPEGSQEYRKNADDYKARLLALDSRFASRAAAEDVPPAVFADRFPFVYLAEDYDLEYEAAFEGCTTDAEASFDTIIRLSDRLNEWQLSRVFITESSDRRLAETVANMADGKEITIVTLNSMQSIRAEYLSDNTSYSYIKIMEEDLNLLFGGNES